MNDSAIPGLYRLTVGERITELQRLGWLSDTDAAELQRGQHIVTAAVADKMIENVVGVFGLPLAVAPNFIVNGRNTIVPLVVEEPSIVAGLSSAAKLAHASGGFTATSVESLLTGQVYVSSVDDIDEAVAAVVRGKPELIDLANSVHPRLLARGGGVRELDVHPVQLTDKVTVIAIHVLVDTCDAMGANIVNAICEAIAPRIAELCAGKVALRILSNLADRSLFHARVCYRLADLEKNTVAAVTTRDAIILASQIAHADPYRAATHNKGIMNGIDALAIATGNDWRAIEAGAHAYAAATGKYRPLSSWSADDAGNLTGEISIPLKVGIVGGTVAVNRAAAMSIAMTGVKSARELAELMAVVGLAQNFAALRALSTGGIQHGHMRLHARSVVAAAGAPDDVFDDVVSELIAAGDISASGAKRLLSKRRMPESAATGPASYAAGKVILLGEHGAVYGKHVLAVPIANAMASRVTRIESELTVSVPDWGMSLDVDTGADATGVSAAIALILRKLDIKPAGYAITVRSRIPPGMGLGSSAAFAVAIIRAFNLNLKIGLNDDDVNALAFECERLAHGTPSGIDNAVATYAESMLFRKADTLQIETLDLTEALPLVIACSNKSGMTRVQVEGVRSRYDRMRSHYEAVFSEMDVISREGAAALVRRDYESLGSLMNVCHGLLNAIEVSTPDLENMVGIARAGGAVGAKLTGAGGGGSIVALCPGVVDDVTAALRGAGYRTIDLDEKEAELE